jgi:hypothetical protein
MTMPERVSPKPRRRGPGRPFAKGRSGNPSGRRPGSRNKATLAAAALLDGEFEALTRKAVELALAGDPTALRLCLERLLSPRRERAIRFRLPSLATARREASRVAPGAVLGAMNTVLSALARGEITPCEGERIAGMVATFVAAFETTKKADSGFNMLRILTDDDDHGETDDDDPDDDPDEADGEADPDDGDEADDGGA